MNIFARELVFILGQHGRELGNLFGLRTATYQIFPNKITRLKRSLTEDITATLNAEELALLQTWVPLDSEGNELRHLRAALVAEAVRHLLGGRMNRDLASHLGDLTLHLLVGQSLEQVAYLRDELLETMRGDILPDFNERGALRGLVSQVPAEAGHALSQAEQALEAAVETYEQGALWLEVARETSERGTRLGYLAQANALLNRARELTADAPTIAQRTSEQQEWLAIIDAALVDGAALG